jgi:hypothetical protein
MYHVDQCSNCGINVSRELAVVTPIGVQHRVCADRFGVGTHGRPLARDRGSIDPNLALLRTRPRR